MTNADLLGWGLGLLGLGAALVLFTLTTRQLTREFRTLREPLIAVLIALDTRGWIQLQRDEHGNLTDSRGRLVGYSVPQTSDHAGTLVVDARPAQWWRRVDWTALAIYALGGAFIAAGVVLLVVRVQR